MKIKEYFNSLISRRKPISSSKSLKPKSHHGSIPFTDCHYEICGYEDPNKLSLPPDHLSRTQVLLNRHAQLVNTIVEIRSQQDYRTSQENVFFNRNYSNILTTSKPYQEISHENSLSTKIRQRSKIRTNPWIKQKYSINNRAVSSGLIHSESFPPQTISNGNIHSTIIKPSNIILHQSDSGQGFSLSSSRMIDSSSPDNTSSDGPILDEKQYYRFPKTNPLDNKQRRGKKSSHQTRYQNLSNTRIVTNSPKIKHNSSPRLHNDYFSMEFEDIVENECLNKQRSPSRKSPFILPLDETDIQSSSLGYLTSGTLKRTNSHTILKHIEEIENEIRIIKNLNLNTEEQILSSNVYTNQDERQLIHEQVDQWIDECLTTTTTKHQQPTTLLHNECSHLSNKNHQTSSLPKLPKKTTELMTAFYLTSIPTTKRISSTIDQSSSSSSSSNSQIITKNFKSIHECPF